MADDLAVDDGDEGELGDPAVAFSEFVKQTCFGRLRPIVPVERTDDDTSDVLHVAG
ncbi:MAG TPA: hypothetical protein VLN74_01725 [Ilumatobacteraceae bacterium]|nr:hypothetical protein [Ilumatobacteraceae bacterium]